MDERGVVRGFNQPGRRGPRRGFTLTELLIVLGIVALGLVTFGPRIADAGPVRPDDALVARLTRARSAIALYTQTHSSRPALIETGWRTLVEGGYLDRAPENPLIPIAAHRTRIVPGHTGAHDAGWYWSGKTGAFGATFFDECAGRVDLTRP